MCGAFSLQSSARELSERFEVKADIAWEQPRYNIRPSQAIPVILNSDPDDLTLAKWGVDPHYDRSHKMFIINARAESLLKPTWKTMLAEGRCLIPADGFYEWQTSGKSKIPYRFELKDKGLFAFAGLWHLETDKQGRQQRHAVIITTEPNSLVASIHDRMPAILRPEDEEVWLNPDNDPEAVKELLKPYPVSKMHKYRVSTLVNSAKNDNKAIINAD